MSKPESARQVLTYLTGEFVVPMDRVHPRDVCVRYLGHDGIPQSADAIAYDPVGRALVVATSAGRVKVVGEEGVQALLQSPRMTPTDAFCVIPGLAAALRATAGGVVELWVWDRAAGCVDALTLVDDADPLAPVTVTVLDHAPVPGVILAGTDRGSVHVLGVTVEGEQGKLHALEYWIPPLEGSSQGPVLAAASCPAGGAVLVATPASLTLWGWTEGVAATAHPTEPASPFSAACWVGARGHAVAAGHESGDVTLWALPSGGGTGRLTQCRLVCPAPQGTPCAPVSALRYVGGPAEHVLARGGCPVDSPDRLALVSTLPVPGGVSAREDLPWLGYMPAGHRHSFTLLPSNASPDAGPQPPSCTVVLVENGGALFVDLSSRGEPSLVPCGVQSKPPISAAVLAAPDPVLLNPACPIWIGEKGPEDPADLCQRYPNLLPALSVRRIADAGARAVARERVGHLSCGLKVSDLLQAGTPPAEEELAATKGHILFTGHRDGATRLWDARGEVLRHIATVSAPASTSRDLSPAGAVTTVAACPAAGWVASGHESGEVRLSKWVQDPSQHPTTILGPGGARGSVVAGTLMSEGAVGWACVLRCAAEQSAVTAVAVSSAFGVVVAGYASGAVAVIDALRYSLMCLASPADRAIASLRLGILSIPILPSKSAAPRAGLGQSGLEMVSESETEEGEGATRETHRQSGGARQGAFTGYVSDTALERSLSDSGGPRWGTPGRGRDRRRAQAVAPLRQPVAVLLDADARTAVLSLDSGELLGSGTWTVVRSESPGVDVHVLAGDGSPMDAPRAPPYVVDRQLGRLKSQQMRMQDDKLESETPATNNWDERTRGPAQPPGSVSSSSQGGQTTPKPSNLDALRNYYGQPDAAANPDTDVPRAMRRSGSAKTVPDRALFANLERFPGPPDARSGRSSDSEDAAQLVNTPSRRRQGSRPESHVSDIVFGGTVADLTRPSGRLRVSESLCGYHDVAFILTASQAYLRIYSPVTVLHGNHATLRKAFLPEPIESAYAFAALHGPAVACLSPAASLHVYALPNLSRLHKVPLQPHVGPAWRAPDGAVPAGAAAKASCFSRDGAQGAVVTVAGDVVRFGLTAASAPPPPALAPAAPAGVQAGPRRTAAPLDTAFSFLRVEPGAERHSGADPLAALLATRGPAGAPSPLIARPAGDAVAMGSGVGAVVGRTPAGIDAISEEDAEGESGHVPSTPSAVRFTAPGWDTASASATTPSSGPLLGFFRAPDPFALRPPRDDVDFWAGPGMASVPEELPRGVPSADSPASSPVRSGAPSFFERLRTGAANFVSRVREHRVRPPPRPASAGERPPGPVIGGQQHASSSGHTTAKAPGQRRDGGRGGRGRGSEGWGGPGGGIGGAERAEGWESTGAPRARTVEEIKAKYGRGRKDAGSVGAQMGDNLAAMQQRGERIAEIERRAEEMREDAAGFAALAKELNRRM